MSDKTLPPDLQDRSEPADLSGDYYNVFIQDLDLNTEYKLQFAWILENGEVSEDWSPVFKVTTDDEVLEIPQFTLSDIRLGEPGYVQVKWNGKNESGDDLKNYKQIHVLYKKKDTADAYQKAATITKPNEYVNIKIGNGTYLFVLQAETALGKFSDYSQPQEIKTFRRPAAVTNISTTWLCNGGLSISWTFDTSTNTQTNYNGNVSKFRVFLTEWDGVSEGDTAEFTASTINLTSSSQGFILDRLANITAFNTYQDKFKVSIIAWESAEVFSETTSYTQASAYSTCLLPPLLNLSKDTGSYLVSWSFDSNQNAAANIDDVDKIIIEEFVLENNTLQTSYNSAAPVSTPVVISSGEDAGTYDWVEVVANTKSNPVSVSTAYNSPSAERWVRAKFFDRQGKGTEWSLASKVKPDQFTSVDDTAPGTPTSLAVTAKTFTDSEVKNGTASFNISWVNDPEYEKHGGVIIGYRRYTNLTTPLDTSYTTVIIPFPAENLLTSTSISNFTQNQYYGFRIAGYNIGTGRISTSWSSDTVAIAGNSVAPSAPIAPEVYVSDAASNNQKTGPFTVRVRQEAKKANNTPLEEYMSYFEIWAIPATETIADDTKAQRIGTLTSAAPNGVMTYTEGNFFVNPGQSTTPTQSTTSASFKFYSKSVGLNGKVSSASALTTAKPILFLTNAYIADLSADKITTGTLAATQTITVGTGTNAIKIASASSDSSTYIQSGTGGYNSNNSGFYVGADGKFSLKQALTFDGTDLTVQGRIVIKSLSNADSEITGNLKFNGSTASIYKGTISNSALTTDGFVLNERGLVIKYGTKEVGFGITADNLNPTEKTFKVFAEAGEIGKWSITQNSLYSSTIKLDTEAGGAGIPAITVTDDGSAYWFGITTPQGATNAIKESSTVLWAGQEGYSTRSNAVFRVTGGGKLFATNAEITGKILASSGGFGTITNGVVTSGWTITNGLIESVGTSAGGSKVVLDGATGEIRGGKVVTSVLKTSTNVLNANNISVPTITVNDPANKIVFNSAGLNAGELYVGSYDGTDLGFLYLGAPYNVTGKQPFLQMQSINDTPAVQLSATTGSLTFTSNILYLNTGSIQSSASVSLSSSQINLTGLNSGINTDTLTIGAGGEVRTGRRFLDGALSLSGINSSTGTTITNAPVGSVYFSTAG